MWNNNTNQDLYVLDKEGYKLWQQTKGPLTLVENFWKLNKQVPAITSIAKRAPSDFLHGERNFYCPCDTFDLFDTAIKHATYCQFPMSKCIEKSVNFIDYDNNNIASKRSVSSVSSFTYEEAYKLCEESLKNITVVAHLIETGK
jgi:hypothetical protein